MDQTSERSERAGGRVSADLLQALAAHASIRRYARGESVYQAGTAADRWYHIVAGIAARCVDLSDGRRQILEFLLPGDFFGFSARAEHVHGVEVMVSDTRISSYCRRSLEDLAVSDPRIERGLRELAFEAIRRLDDRVLTVGRLRATERVGAFLMEMAERVPRDPGERIALPMSRFEIADYLGLSMESVSRSIGQLKGRAAISLLGPHHVEVLDSSILGAQVQAAREEIRSPTQSRGVSPSRKA
jgi:CRP/FNR family transcriptional regulator, nitrogen fixation regulation protein